MPKAAAKRTNPRNSTAGKRSSILRAATRVFARNVYFNSKVADIARAADVADGTVYLYFKSKEEILHSIFDQNMAEAIKLGRELIKKARDPREQLRRIAQLHLERLGADRDLAVVFQVELRGSTKFMEEFSAAAFAEYLNILCKIFQDGQRTGVFRKELNPKIAAKMFFGALDEMATNWIISKRHYKLEPMADLVMDVFLNGVSA